MASSNDSAMTEVNSTMPACDMTINLEYDTVLAALCVVMGLFGLVYTFVGYRCFKAVMFLSGLIFGGTVVFVMAQEERIIQHSLSSEAIIGISVGIGALCGFITMLVRYVGLFLQGFFLGLLIAIGAIMALQKFYHPSTPWIPVGILFGTGVLFSLLTLKWQKTFVIISTSVMGAALICTCLEYFMEKFLLLRYIWEALMAAPSVDVCWYTWVILGVWPVFSILGSIVQWKFTGKGYDHTDIIIWQGQRKRVRTHLVRNNHLRGHSTDTMMSVAVAADPGPTVSRNPQPQPGQNMSFHCEESLPRSNAENRASNFDTLPPSYDDVQRGIGKPVTERDQTRIIRTKHGSFLAPHGRRNESGDVASSRHQNPSEHQSSRNSSQRSSLRGSGRSSRSSSSRGGRGRGRRRNRRHDHSRSPGGRQAASAPSRPPERQGPRPTRESSGSRGPSGHRRGNSGGPSRGRVQHSSSVDDRQSLLSSEASAQQSASGQGRQPRASEAMVAHAMRLRAAQERRGNNI